MAHDLFTDDLSRANNDELFSAIDEFAKAQPSEGWRHDYTAVWGDSALEKTAAFANTFGGLLIVGVSKPKQDVVCKVVGVDSQVELKTAVASSIAANISPTPFYEVFECHAPGQSNKRFCVVRIRSSGALHLLTKKGLKPVYVRNEDEARPADAAQLRRLIDRERELRTDPMRARQQAMNLAGALIVYRGYREKDSPTWFYSGCTPSPTYLQIALTPSEPLILELDRSHEVSLARLVAEVYPRINDGLRQNVAESAESRRANSYEYVWYHKACDYEVRWLINGDGSVANACEMKRAETGTDKALWSVVDLATDIVLFLKLSMLWWQLIRYFGDGHLAVQLRLPGLSLARTDDGIYMRGMDLTYQTAARRKPLSMEAGVILATARPTDMAGADVRLNYFSATTDSTRIATSLLNSLLRCLGHAAVWELLEENVRLLSAG